MLAFVLDSSVYAWNISAWNDEDVWIRLGWCQAVSGNHPLRGLLFTIFSDVLRFRAYPFRGSRHQIPPGY
jgi:hypothetical protein